MKKAIVSVVMITYGHERYIIDAVSSILMQDCNFEIELIIANDKSPDETDLIVRNYLDKTEIPKNITVLYTKHEVNMGMMPNFNWAMAQATGKYIAICEGDDYWTDALKLQKQVDFLEKNQDYAGCAHQSTVLKKDKSFPFNMNVPDEVMVNDIIGKRLFHTATLVFNRSALTLFLNAPVVFSGDRLLFLCISIAGKFKFFSESMGIYRIHGAGASSTARLDQLVLDLNSVAYLKEIKPGFPAFRYLSYIYATIGLLNNGSIIKRLYYISLSFLYSFSYFPENILRIFKYIKNRV